MRALLLGLSLLLPSVAAAQGSGSAPDSSAVVVDGLLERQVDMFLRMGQPGEAMKVLERRGRGAGLDAPLERRLARIYRDLGAWAKAESLLVHQLGDTPMREAPLGTLRLLAEARLEQDDERGGRAVLDAILEADPADPARRRLVANTLVGSGRRELAIRVLEEGRAAAADDAMYRQYLAQLYSDAGRPLDGAREYLRVVRNNPANFGLVRGRLLDLVEEHPGSAAPLVELAREEHAAQQLEGGPLPELDLLFAELLVRNGESDAAWELVEPLVGQADFRQSMLQMAMAGLADSRLADADPESTLRRLRLGARVLRGLLTAGGIPEVLQPRLYEALNRTLLAMLENRSFADLPPYERIELLDDTRATILEMSQAMPANPLTTDALLQLADTYVDALDRPRDALALFERLEQSPGAASEQVFRARLGLGRSYMAMGDTALARDTFTTLGRDSSYQGGQGRAHYHLGLLDIMGGHFETAQDRLAIVARTAPTAPFTNDALDLALLLAEEGLSGEANRAGLLHFGRALHSRMTSRDDSLRAHLRAVVDGKEGPVRQRARLELARELWGDGEQEQALEQLSQLRLGSPNSRYAPRSLQMRGEFLEEAGRPAEALQVYTELVQVYDQYVGLDNVRDRIRELRSQVEGQEGELP